MSVYRRSLRQTATYWAPSTRPDGTGSEPDFYKEKEWSSPAELICKWEDKQELFRNDDGEEMRSKAMVYLDEDVLQGGYLYLGGSTESDPKAVEGAYEIMSFEVISDLLNRSKVRMAMLRMGR